MKLFTSDNSDLMEVDALSVAGDHLIITGTIMGAMPVEAHLTPVELRKALKLLNLGIIWALVKMLLTFEKTESQADMSH